MSKTQIGSSIATTTNAAYGMVKYGQRDDPEYEVINVSRGTTPPLIDGTNKIHPSHRLLPNIRLTTAPPTGGSVGVTREGGEVVVYATIPEDQ